MTEVRPDPRVFHTIEQIRTGEVVVIPPGPFQDMVIAERAALGLDKKDEDWDGVLHMVPSGTPEHQRIEAGLIRCWYDVAARQGLIIVPEVDVFDPDIPGQRGYKCPDLLVVDPETLTERGVEGSAALMVVEIRSPRDESFEKLPIYEHLGVGEVLVIDRDSKAVRHWLNGPTGLVEQVTADGRATLRCLPTTLWCKDRMLVVRTDDGTTRI